MVLWNTRHMMKRVLINTTKYRVRNIFLQVYIPFKKGWLAQDNKDESGKGDLP